MKQIIAIGGGGFGRVIKDLKIEKLNDLKIEKMQIFKILNPLIFK